MPNGLSNLFDDLLDKTIVFSYNKIGYGLRRDRWNPADLEVDLTGKVCIVTGANSGLGYATTQQLAQRGASVYMIARNRIRGEAAQAKVIEATGNSNVYLEIADVSNLSDIRQFVERFRQITSRLDILIHNAAALTEERQLSVDGIELTFATNVLGPFLLTQLLIPLMKQSAPARIIIVSSGGMYASKLDIDNLQYEKKRFNGVMAYAQTKRAEVILTELGAQRLTGTGVTVNAMHPGWVKTPGLQTALPTFSKLMNVSLRTPEQGADTIVWLAVAPHLESETAKFWFDRRARETHKTSRTKSSVEDRQKLWTECMRLSGLAETG